MTQFENTATRLEFYLVWLTLRRVARTEDRIAESLRRTVAALLDRIDVLLELDIAVEHRWEIADAIEAIRCTRLPDDALCGACAHLADLLALVLSEPRVPLRRPRIDQVTYMRLLQLARRIDEKGHGAGEDLWAERLATRAKVSLDRVHAAIAWMLADGVVRLPVGDEGGRADAFRLSDPESTEAVLFSSHRDLDWHAYGDPQDRVASAEIAAPDACKVVMSHGRDMARTAFFFELLRRKPPVNHT